VNLIVAYEKSEAYCHSLYFWPDAKASDDHYPKSTSRIFSGRTDWSREICWFKKLLLHSFALSKMHIEIDFVFLSLTLERADA
jgi:hypothetical protein